MKIGEILELSQKQRMSDIAKEYLNIGEKPAREALKNAGCYSISGKKGWHFDGSPEVLEKSIYEFATVKGRAKAKANVTTNEQKNLKINEHINENTDMPKNEIAATEENNNTSNEQINKPTIETNNVGAEERKRASFDLRPALVKQLKIKAVTEDRNLYELVEEAIEEYLNK